MSSSATIVTALYDIGRDKLIGKCAYRSFTKYLNWFKNLLSINAPMVVFIPSDLHSYVLENRDPEYSTKIVIRKFEDLVAYKYHDRIQSTIDTMVKEPNDDGIFPEHFRECPEFMTARYETIIYSKFDFLKEVANDNPYNTNYFIWLDAGTFYMPPPFDVTLSWPDPYKISILGDKFLVSNHKFDVNDKSSLNNKRNYLRSNQNEICAFILGGKKNIIDKVHKDFWSEVDNALDMGVINNEQHILQLIVREHPEDYFIWNRTRYPKLSEPLCDRMIPYELSRNTYMGEKYQIFPDFKLLTISTKEIPHSKYERWEATAKYYGYNYEILGRDQEWLGYGMKINMYFERLKTVTEPYVVLTDSNDLFFVGPPEELYNKFIQIGKDIIVGAEMKPHYINGKYDKPTVTAFFKNFKTSELVYPNSGFIMGKTDIVKRFMELNLDCKDDQAACFDTMYDGTMTLTLDHDTVLVGNVPNYREENFKSTEYFIFDPKLRRYKNKLNGEIPVVFHFPGSNWYPMQEFYLNTHPELAAQNSESPNSIWAFVVIIILVAILIYFLSQY